MFINKYFSRKLIQMFIACLVVSLTLLVTPVAAATDSYQQGYDFGLTYRQEIVKNIVELDNLAQQNKVNLDELRKLAYANDALYQQILPDKVAYMQGLATATGLAYEKILIFNSSDRTITGFQGECTTFMANGKAVAGGKGTIIAKNRDVGVNALSEINIHEARRHTDNHLYKAAYIDIPQVAETYKFIGSRSAGRWGYGMGINEFQVIASDNDANSRDALDFKSGLHDNDVIRLILERAKTAREGVQVVTDLVEKYGQAWNGIMFEIGDPNEFWIVEVTGRRWVAKRYVDTFTARSNQYQITDDYDLAAKDLLSFAESQQWIKPGLKKINFRAVYGTLELYPANNDNLAQRPAMEKLYNTEMRYQRAMQLLAPQNGYISIENIMPMMRDHYDEYTLPSGKVIPMHQKPFYSSEYADWYNREWVDKWPSKDTINTSMYIRGVCGHDLGWGATMATAIMVARPEQPNELGLMLHSYMQPCLSTFVPFYVGLEQVPTAYQTPEAAFAFHGIAMRAFGNYDLYHDAIRAAFQPYETQLLKDLFYFEEEYKEEMVAKNHPGHAQELLNKFVADKAAQALQAANTAETNMQKAAAKATAWTR
ncbi:C69 family dipeptidase [Succinispira mobilis]|uniref:C69 family dipeptidase n=1 Tax=Succinispira mobilis TaxID=78120 RepID=UPI0003710D8C|nr:C69 family dipeptidase [Succinispira mobilis]